MPKLTTTSYAILGLLHVRAHTAYELAAQSKRSLRFAWPTAESRLYAEPKRLAAEGLIAIEHVPAGPNRQRQLYRITDAGRAALRDWLNTEPSEPRAEFEFLLRVLFADAASIDEVQNALGASGEQAARLYDEGHELLRGYRDLGVVFPDRMHLNMIWAVFVRDLLQLIIDWCEFAERELADGEAPTQLGESPRAHELLDMLVNGRPVLPPRTTFRAADETA